MKKDSLYKVFAGCFYMLDESGEKTDYYKSYDGFRNTYGLAFFINSPTKGRCYVLYFARDNSGRNCRTVIPVGKLIEENNKISIKTRYNTFVWDATNNLADEKINSLYQWVKENGNTYIPGLTKYPGVTEYFKQGYHF